MAMKGNVGKVREKGLRVGSDAKPNPSEDRGDAGYVMTWDGGGIDPNSNRAHIVGTCPADYKSFDVNGHRIKK